MNRFNSAIHASIEKFPFASGFLVGFFGTCLPALLIPEVIENFWTILLVTLALLLVVVPSSWSDKAPVIIMIISLYIPIFGVLALVILGASIYQLAETIIEQSAIIAAIATFFLTSLKISTEAWRAWKDNANKEQDLKLRREIFEYEKSNEKSSR